MNRRLFLQSLAATSLFSSFASVYGENAPRRIRLCSSWQTVNIGDIGHTPGVLALLEKHLPDAEIRLWPGDVSDGVEEMLIARFPKLRVVKAAEAIKQAFEECDFLLHGSGPSLVAAEKVARWRKETGKPYGVYGITLSPSSSPDSVIDTLSGAAFVYFRDSRSLDLAVSKGVKAPVMTFGPDGAFAVDLRNDAKAEAFLKAHDLQEAQFLCCIPRYNTTPYWLIPKKKKAINLEQQEKNNALKERDHAPLREAIIRVVRETKMKVLLVPEDETQVALGREMLLDKLPEDVKSRVVWRENFWLTDEAVSTYVRSAGLFGNEMHSPIMCIGHGIPAIVCRWESQTTKGFMWSDIGLGEWLFDFDNDNDRTKMPDAVVAIAKDPAAARVKAAKARSFVFQNYAKSMGLLSELLNKKT
ncbi:MAG: polysaccharide pyruvyl transferase family protein [Verrucomicrobiota bacterium]